ncbi:MAG TPA: hypothetical protein VNA16_00080 [Abditibacteriaceae bacterium]|nr:hypothetical protein [Abditibacteriaceae bacterium]
MKVQIHIEDIQETVEAPDAAAVLHLVKREAARRAPFLLRGFINGMGDLAFAGEAVKRANKSGGRSDPAPGSAQEFLAWAVQRGYATIVEP